MRKLSGPFVELANPREKHYSTHERPLCKLSAHFTLFMASRGVTTRMKNKDLLDLFIKCHKGRYYKYAHNKNTLKKQIVSLIFLLNVFLVIVFSVSCMCGVLPKVKRPVVYY